MSVGTPQTKNETPTMAGALQAVIQTALLQMNTCLPGEVQSYNPLTGTVNVQPSIKRKYVKDAEVVLLPIINNVPLVFPRANDAAITFPVKKGDSVLLIFSQRSIENWKTTGGTVEAGDPRHHDLSDAFAIPGVYPATAPLIGVDGENLVIRHGLTSKITVKKDEVEVAVGTAKLVVKQSGKFSIGNGVVEFLDLMEKHLTRVSTILDNVIALTVPTGVGPSGPPINSALFTADKVNIELLKTQLGAIKA